MSKFGPQFARQKDKSHQPIVEGLEAAGIVVFDVSGLPGLGFDILCYKPNFAFIASGGSGWTLGKWQPFEIKNPEPAKRVYRSSKRQLRPLDQRGDQRRTDSEKKARQKAPIPIVTCVEDCLKYF